MTSAARRSAASLNVPSDRAAAFGAVAGYLTSTPAGLCLAPGSTSNAFTQILRTLAGAQISPDTTKALQAPSFTTVALRMSGTLPRLRHDRGRTVSGCLCPSGWHQVRTAAGCGY